MDLQSSFTTNEELDDLEDQDVTTNIVGFIDAVTAPGPSGKNKDGDILFKFRVSNGCKKINILIWEIDLINKWRKEICCNRVININGGYCRSTSRSRYNDENNIVSFEIVVRENTTISFLGYYIPESTETNQLQAVNFDSIQSITGLVEISGYVRTPFSLVHNRSGLTTYGIGAVTDGLKKITVQVKQFSKSQLEIGDYVTVRGIVKGEGSLVILFCDTMDDIQLDSEKKPLSAEAVHRGGRPVKRILKN